MKTEGANGGEEFLGELWGRAEELFGAGDVENGGKGIRVGRGEGRVGRRQTFNAGRKSAGALEEGGTGAGFFGVRSREMSDAGKDVELGAGEPGFDADRPGTRVAGADCLTRWGPFEDNDGSVFEMRAEAEHGLRGKFADIEAGVQRGEGHGRPAFSG